MARIVNAIFEEGVLKPLEPINIKEHTKVRLILEFDEERKRKAEGILALARKSCEGLSEEELSILESTRLNITLFFSDRINVK